MTKLCCLLCLFLSSAAFAQLPSSPPIRLGLWESTVNTKVTGIDMPPALAKMAGLDSRDSRVQVCITPETWQKAVANSRDQKDCVRSNEHYTGHTYSFDLSCRSGRQTGHSESVFDSDESGHSTTTLVMDQGNGRAQMHVDATSQSHFVSSDCGGVTPDKPKLIK